MVLEGGQNDFQSSLCLREMKITYCSFDPLFNLIFAQAKNEWLYFIGYLLPSSCPFIAVYYFRMATGQ